MGIKILIVDDSSIVRKSLTKTLRMTELDVESVVESENGQLALDRLNKSERFDLIFLDINMPVMNGLEMLQNARKASVLGDARVIVVSTEGSQIRAQQLLELGVNAQLRKPVRPESLSETVMEVMRKTA